MAFWANSNSSFRKKEKKRKKAFLYHRVPNKALTIFNSQTTILHSRRIHKRRKEKRRKKNGAIHIQKQVMENKEG